MAPMPSSADVLNPGSPNHIRWGPEIGLNYNFFSTTQYIADATAEGVPIVSYEQGFLESQNGLSLLGGLAIDIPISSTVGFMASLHYDNRSVKKTGNVTVPGTLTDTTTGTVIDTVTTAAQESDISVAYITITPTIRFNIGDFFGFVGPSIGIPVSSAISFSTTLLDNRFYYNYNTPQQTQTLNSGTLTIPDLKTRAALDLGVGKYIELSPKMFLVPELDLDLGLTKINNADAGLTSIQFILGLRFE